MEFEKLVLTISERLDNVQGHTKSIVQADLGDLIDDIEDVLFTIRISEHNYQRVSYPLLKKEKIAVREAVGLLFLSYLTYRLRSDITYHSMWPVIGRDLEKYEQLNTFFKDNYLFNGYPTPFLVTCIGNACKHFNLRNAYENREDEHYIRNTILLQMGLLNRFDKLNYWLSNIHSQKTVRTLLDKEDEYFSNSFSQGWRVLRRYRDHIIDSSVAKSQLKQNVWFKEVDIDEALRAAQKKLSAKFVSEDEIENVFFLDKILYEDRLLKFVINAEDLYALKKLSGNEYSVYIDGKYAAKILRDDDKVLNLDKTIIITEPTSFSVHLELKNEDDDVVHSDEITLFDLHDQVLIFDDKGNIYRDFSKKLLSNRVYGMLFDSDLDCDLASQYQTEYFSGYVMLANELSSTNNCMLSYDGNNLFSLNFTATISKPLWIDQLVVYVADSRLVMEERAEFNLKIFDIDDEDEPLKSLHEGVEVIRWTYTGGYVDEEEISDFTAKIKLNPELVCERKHAFMIRYQNQTYHRTVQASIFDQTDKYHVLQREKDGTVKVIERRDIVNYDDLVASKIHFALFNFTKSRTPRYVKDKMKLYGKVDLNKKFQLQDFPKFGETVITSEHLFNDIGDILFKVVRRGIVRDYDRNSKQLILNNPPEYLDQCEFVVLDDTYTVSSLEPSDYKIVDNTVSFEKDYLSICMIYKNNYIGSYVQDLRIDFSKLVGDVEVLKTLYASYVPLLIMEKQLLVEWIEDNLIVFFKSFLSDSYETPHQQTVMLNFDEVGATIEHLLYDIEFYKDEATLLLQEIVVNRWGEKVLGMPILLVYLLSLAQDQKLIAYFLSILPDMEEPEERDEQFVENIINGLLQHHDLDRKDKHNLKIAMHYKNRNFYLKEALQRLQEG